MMAVLGGCLDPPPYYYNQRERGGGGGDAGWSGRWPALIVPSLARHVLGSPCLVWYEATRIRESTAAAESVNGKPAGRTPAGWIPAGRIRESTAASANRPL